MARRLIDAGAYVDAKDNHGRTALYEQIREDRLDSTRLLIDKGADVNVRDISGVSPLDYAVSTGSLDTIALLLAHGARLNDPASQTGLTPINRAAERGNTAIIQYLLQFRPDLSE